MRRPHRRIHRPNTPPPKKAEEEDFFGDSDVLSVYSDIDGLSEHSGVSKELSDQPTEQQLYEEVLLSILRGGTDVIATKHRAVAIRAARKVLLDADVTLDNRAH